MAEVAPSLPSSGPERFRMRGIRKSFGGTVALEGVDFSVRSGEVHALVGENGAGKSTLMKILSGAIPPDGGTIELDGSPFRPRNALEARRSGIAMIYQELSLAPHLSVEANITLGLEPSSHGLIDRRRTRAMTREALDQLGHADIDPERLVRTLPVAARQIVEIARALATGCRVLVLDEPTSSLTQQDTGRLFGVIERLRSQGHAVVYISHFIEEVKQISDRFTVLRDGQVAGSGRTDDVTVEDIVRLMVGREIGQMYPRSSRTPGDILLEVQDLAGRGKPACASFALRRGEILGIAGLVGAGRTELLRAIFGLAPIVDGSVRLGTFLGPASPVRRWMQGAGLLSEDRSGEGLATALDVTSNIIMNLRRDAGPLGFISPARLESIARRWIDTLGIRARSARQPLHALSGGNQQKVALARLLHQDVDVLLLDEPTRGIDVASKSQIYELMDRLAAGDPQAGVKPKAILIVSSYFPELLGMCDRIAVMRRGELGPARPADEFDPHTLMLEATGQGPST